MRACIFLASLQSSHLALAAEATAGAAGAANTCGQAKLLYKVKGCCGAPEKALDVQIVPAPSKGLFKGTTNPCQDMKTKGAAAGLKDNIACFVNDAVNAVEQAGADISEEFKGSIDAKQTPITGRFSASGLCPVNVHWHLGAEHRSKDEFDETFNAKGPGGASRRLGDGDVRLGFRCKHYDEKDAKFTTPYQWMHCKGMKVGETYEVHWPHSAAGKCHTPWQYQSPFYDGVLCNDDAVKLVTGGQLDLSKAVGVHGQVFTIVNDENYYYPELIRGMVEDETKQMGIQVTAYTGSTTGTTRNNTICSQYAPITWQVDRKCHLISASSFDKLCADMKQQADDMSMDLVAHGARELVSKTLSADNQVFTGVNR